MVEALLAVVFGLIGGLARAARSGGLVMPSWEVDEREKRFLDPGVFGTIFVGIAAGLAAWLFNASPADPGIDWRPLGWALIAGFAGDLALDFWVNQKLGMAERQDAGELLDKTADMANTATHVLEQTDKERRELQEKIDRIESKDEPPDNSGTSSD